MLIALFTLAHFLSSFFVKRNKYRYTCAIIFYIVLQLFMESVDGVQPFFNLAMNVGIVLVFAIIGYDVSKIKVVLLTTLYCVLWLFSEIMLMFLLMVLNIQYENFQLMGSFLTKLVLLVVIKFIRNYSIKNVTSEIPRRYGLVILIFPISSVLIIACIFFVADRNYTGNMAIIASIACTVVLITNLLAIILYDKVTEELVLKNQNMLYEKQLQLCEQQIIEREETMLLVRTMRHDLKNHLILIREMLEQKNISKAKDYVNHLVTEVIEHKGSYMNSGNVVVDSLINFKYSVAQREGVRFDADVIVPYELPCEDADICVILGNILDNAIEAAKQCENGYVDLKVAAKKSSLVIIVKNSFDHIIKETSEWIISTTKENKHKHGFGLLSVKRSVDKYNGTMNVEYEDKEFIITIILFVLYK